MTIFIESANPMKEFPIIPVTARAKSIRRPVFGIGINDADYHVYPAINGNQIGCPYYIKWVSILTRCYNKKYQEKQPTYIGCTVISEWLTFSNFRKWMTSQDWEGKQLDKDFIVKGNKIYGPKLCLFIPSSLNLLLVNSAKRRGPYPLGVSFLKKENKFQASISINSKLKSLGWFTTAEEAHDAYVKAKNAEIRRQSEMYPQWSKYILGHLIQ